MPNARKISLREIFDVPSSDLYKYWAKAAKAEKMYDLAWDKISKVAFWNGDKEAAKLMGEIYEIMNGSKEGYEEAVLAERKRSALQVADFTLPDYSGNEQSFAKLKGKVTIIGFRCAFNANLL